MIRQATKRRSDGATKGFTLTEMMVAVAVLLVVIIAISRIFGTASRVTAIGTASSDVLQEAVALEQQMRSDIERITPEGVLAIRCVAVPNNINALSGGPLLNPALPFDAYIRADQIMFFANGAQTIQGYRQGAGAHRKIQGTASRIYYGHGFQVLDAPGVQTGQGGGGGGGGMSSGVRAIDPQPLTGNPMVPWWTGERNFVATLFADLVTGGDYSTSNFDTLDATQPPARQWNLARQAVILADDGGDSAVHLFTNDEGGSRTARSLLDAVVVNGRVDAAATQLNEFRRHMQLVPQGNSFGSRQWLAASGDDQRSILVGWSTPGSVGVDLGGGGMLLYPRAERRAPSMHRVDQALTNSVIATGCSSFAIDWTYEDGTGFVGGFAGIKLDPARPQPWFGIDPNNERGVDTLRNWIDDPDNPQSSDGEPIFVDNIEGPQFVSYTSPILVYEATFGFNRDTPQSGGVAFPDLAYTPWPSALRVTMTLHDPDVRLEAGRQVQFVIDLPNRVKARPQ